MPQRHVVVTGGGRGIGAATARKFKELGDRVTVMGRSRNEIERLADEIGAYSVRTDVSDPASVEAAFMAAGPVDILVNNAGILRTSLLMKTDVRVWEEHLKVNLTGAFLCSLKVLPGMISRGRGVIVNVAGIAGLQGVPYLGAYTASKHGLIGLTRALSAEVGDQGVNVNAVCPTFVDTPVLNAAAAAIAEKAGRSTEESLATLKERNPQNRLLDPSEVAEAIVWLAGDDAISLKGQALMVDGGELRVV